MKRAIHLICAISALTATAFFAEGADKKEFKKEKPQKVSVLLKDANILVSDAQEAYVNGEANKSIELYKKALEAIEKVEAENPDRADSAEFAPVRFRKALCQTEIDRIMLEEANQVSRTVTVSDTSELSKKRAERKKAAETNNEEEVTIKLGIKREDGTETSLKDVEEEVAKKVDEQSKPVDIPAEMEFVKDMLSMERTKDAREALLKVLKMQPEHREARFLMALMHLRENEAKDALVVVDDILEDNPDDEPALLLAAGAYMTTGGYQKSLELLDRAMKINPRRPDGYLNMAWLLLEINPKDLASPEAYYRQAVKLGGKRDFTLEKKLGIKSE